jgi:hypothetical protein
LSSADEELAEAKQPEQDRAQPDSDRAFLERPGRGWLGAGFLLVCATVGCQLGTRSRPRVCGSRGLVAHHAGELDTDSTSEPTERSAVETLGAAVSDDASELIEEMFVQLAGGVTSADGTLSLDRIAASTLFFSDRPERVVGHMTTKQFLDQWGEGPDSFAADPPNAVLSFADASGEMEDAVVTLRSPSLEGDSLRYSIEVLDGTVPQAAGACTLFIDPLGRPLSPVSVAGRRRRVRRRGR